MREKFLRVLSSNVRGLVRNWDAVKTIEWDKYDVVAFNEVWNIKEFENLTVDNFEVKTKKLRINRRGGGTVIYAKTNVECIVLDTPFIDGVIESTGVKISGINFINIYRPPQW